MPGTEGSATTASRKIACVASSIAGVPVIPNGSMLPQRSELRGTGLPSARLQTGFPVASSARRDAVILSHDNQQP